MPRRILLLPLLLLVTTMAFAQAETPLTLPQIGPAPHDQYAPVVASNGVDFLVTWLDDRGGAPTVYAARVRPDGSVLDATGIRIAAFDLSTANTRILGVFRTSGAYIVLFTTQRFLPDGASHWEMYAARVGDDGKLVEPAHVITDKDQPYLAASNGSRILLVNVDSLTLLNDRGEIVQEALPLPMAHLSAGAIASNGSTFLLLASAYPFDSMTFIAVDASGRSLGSSQVAVRFGAPIIGTDGTDYLVLYNDGSSAATTARVVTANASLGAATTIPPGAISTQRGTLLWTGSQYLLVSSTNDAAQELATATLSRNGAITGGPHRLSVAGTFGASNLPSAAWNGSRALVASASGTQQDARGWDIDSVIVGVDGSPVTPDETISNSAALQVSPAIGTGGANDLVAWLEPTGLYAARVTRGGAVLDPHGILVAADAVVRSRDLLFSGNVLSPRVVFDGLAYLVAWGNTLTGLHAQRIDPATGVLLGAQQTLLSACVFSFDLGRDASGTNVSGPDVSGTVAFASTCSGFVAQRIGFGGAVGAPVAIPLPPDLYVGTVDAAWNGAEWLLAFTKEIPIPSGISPPPTRGNVYALRLSPALAPLDVQPIPIAISEGNERFPLVATNGADFLIAWKHFGEDGAGVRARTVRADGATSEPLVVANDGSAAADLVWDGARYAVALTTPNADRTYGIWLTHVGATPAGDRVPISLVPTAAPQVVLAAVPGAPLRAVYDRTAPEPEYGGVWRVFFRDIAGGRRRVTTTFPAVVPY